MSTDTNSREADRTVLGTLVEVSPRDFLLGDRIVLGERRDGTPILSTPITEYSINPKGCKGNVHVKTNDNGSKERSGAGCYAICAPWKVMR